MAWSTTQQLLYSLEQDDVDLTGAQGSRILYLRFWLGSTTQQLLQTAITRGIFQLMHTLSWDSPTKERHTSCRTPAAQQRGRQRRRAWTTGSAPALLPETAAGCWERWQGPVKRKQSILSSLQIVLQTRREDASSSCRAGRRTTSRTGEGTTHRFVSRESSNTA